MRIERIELDGFGRFHAASWELPAGLTVLVGANEAGKTTLLNALRALLFGFEPSRDGRAWYPAFGGGRRGGRLVLRTRDDERWIIERHGEKGGGGALAVRAPHGSQGGQETLDRLLRGADKDLFTNIFAFGLGELQTLASLSAEGVRGRIYGARAGLGGTSAIDLERRLRQEMDGDFLPSASKRPLNALLARIEELRAEIAVLARQPEEHAEAHRERERRLADAVEARDAARRLREEDVRLRLLRDAAPAVAALDGLERELAAGDPALDDVPPDVVATLERHEGAVERARAVLATIDEGLADARREREAVVLDDAILRHAPELTPLLDERGRRSADAERRAEVTAAVRSAEAAIREQVEQTGGMTEEALLTLDHSIPAVEATREHEAALGRVRSALAEADMRRRALVTDDGVADAVAPSGGVAPDLDTRLAAYRDLEALRLERAAGSSTEGAGVDARRLALSAAAAAIGALAGAQLEAPFLGAALGILAVVALLFLAPRSGRQPPAGDEARRSTAARTLGLEPDPPPAVLAEVGERLAAERARRDILAADRTRGEARRVELASRERDLESAHAAARLEEERWCAWLAERGLPAGLSPEAARHVLAAGRAARRAAGERDTHRAQLAALEEAGADHAARVDGLVLALGLSAPRDAADREARLVGLGERLEGAREARRRVEELDARVGQLEGRRAPAATAVGTGESALAVFLAAVGVRDADDLRRRALAADARRSLRASIRGHRERLAGIAGSDALELVEDEARRSDAASIEARAREAATALEEAEAREQEANAAIGAIDARIGQLEAAAELGDRRQELAVLEGRAAGMARAWAVRALALRLLSATRARHERERQPDVVRAAEVHFERITGGRYARILAPPGEATVRVETEGGESRTTDELSRGTAEQLYLALRFGLIEEFAEHAEALPVVMDDILVNFDADRAARAASAIRHLAARHQVLYFTCHPWTAELLDPERSRTLSLS